MGVGKGADLRNQRKWGWVAGGYGGQAGGVSKSFQHISEAQVQSRRQPGDPSDELETPFPPNKIFKVHLVCPPPTVLMDTETC